MARKYLRRPSAGATVAERAAQCSYQIVFDMKGSYTYIYVDGRLTKELAKEAGREFSANTELRIGEGWFGCARDFSSIEASKRDEQDKVAGKSMMEFERGVVYIVTKPFVDAGKEFSVGDKLTNTGRWENPRGDEWEYYLDFKEHTFMLNVDGKGNINFDEYLAVYDSTGRITPVASAPFPPMPTRQESFRALLICLVFVAGSIWIIYTPNAGFLMKVVGGWGGIIFFGLLAVVSIIERLRKR